MPDEPSHEGLLVRQVLKGKKKARIIFIPADTNQPAESTYLKIADDSPSAWRKLLGNPPDLDIDQGIILVRFNQNGNSGIARFLPNQQTQAEIVHPFQQAKPDPHAAPEPVGSEDFLKCIDGKRIALGANFNSALAAAECLPQLVK